MIRRVQAENPHLEHLHFARRACSTLDRPEGRALPRSELAEDPRSTPPIRASSSSRAAPPASRSSSRARTTTTPTTPRPPRRCAAVTGDSVLLLALPIAHNLPLACPGIQGFFFQGGKVVLSPTTRPEEMFELIEKHRVTHIKVVPALLIRLINDPAIGEVRPVLAEAHPERRPAHAARGAAAHPRADPERASCRRTSACRRACCSSCASTTRRKCKLETCGRPISPDDEVRLRRRRRARGAGRRGRRAHLPRPVHAARLLRRAGVQRARSSPPDGFYRSGDLMRRHPSGNYVVEGRKKDLINRGGEKISAEEIENLILTHPAVQNVACVPMPDPDLGERMCACLILKPGKQLDARRAGRVPEGQGDRQVQAARAAASLRRLPGVHLRQGVEEDARRAG